MMIDNTSISLKQMRTIIKAIYSAPNASKFSLSLHRIHESSIFIVILSGLGIILNLFAPSPQLSYLLFFLACFCYFLGDALFGPFGMAAAMYVVYKIGIYRFELNEDISQITVKKNNVIYSIDWNYSFTYPEEDAFIFIASPKNKRLRNRLIKTRPFIVLKSQCTLDEYMLLENRFQESSKQVADN